MSNPSDIQAFLATWQDAWSRQDIDAVLAMFDETFQFEDIPIGLHAQNKAEMRTVLETTFQSVPNFTMEIFEHYAAPHLVVTKWRQSGNMTTQIDGLDLKDHPYEVVTTSIIQTATTGAIIAVSDNWNAAAIFL